MKMFKKVLAVAFCLMMLAGLMSVGMIASAVEDEAEAATTEETTGAVEEIEVPGAVLSDGPDSVEAVRWFPAHPSRYNDYLWEVEFEKDGCQCQSFLWDPEIAYLDITYNEDNSVTFKRNANGDDFYWPRIRTFTSEDYPLIDMTKANTLYFDFVVEDGYCNVQIQQIDMFVKLSASIAKACGVSGVADSNGDLPAGHYKGSINLLDALDDLAAESGTDSQVWAKFYKEAIENGTAFVPSLSIYVVGNKETASVTMNSLYISTPEDTNGDLCTYADAAMAFDKETAAMINEEQQMGAQEEEEVEEEEEEETEEETEVTTTTKKEVNVTENSETTTTVAADADSDAAKKDGDNGAMLWIIIAVAAVVVIGGGVAAVIIINKKKA